MELQVAKYLLVKDLGVAPTKAALTKIEAICGVGEGAVGDEYHFSEGFAYYLFNRRLASMDDFYANDDCTTPLAGANLQSLTYVYDSRGLDYQVVGHQRRKRVASSGGRVATLTVPTTNGVVRLAAVMHGTADALGLEHVSELVDAGVDFHSLWVHNALFAALEKLEIFSRTTVDTSCFGKVVRHAVAGGSGFQVLLATNGKSVAIVVTDMSWAMRRVGLYPDDLLSAELFGRALPSLAAASGPAGLTRFDGPAWMSTCPPDKRAVNLGRNCYGKSLVGSHLKILRLALEDGIVPKADIPRAFPQAMSCTLADLVGTSYCTALHLVHKKEAYSAYDTGFHVSTNGSGLADHAWWKLIAGAQGLPDAAS